MTKNNSDNLSIFSSLHSNEESTHAGNEFQLISEYINELCGILIPPEKSYLIETRLTKLMLDVGAGSFMEFYEHITTKPNENMQQMIINAITTNETMWFRDGVPWKLLEEIYLPNLIAEYVKGNINRIRFWSAAVSTGQEIYSTVMCVDDYLSRNPTSGVDISCFEFIATDISGNTLDIAKKGRYDSISIMRGLDDYHREKYFTKLGSVWEIDPKIRDAVRFEKFNLKNEYTMFGLFNVIFCRYVLIYFSETLKKITIDKMHNALSDGGVLLTGNYVLFDLLQGDFDINHYGNLLIM